MITGKRHSYMRALFCITVENIGRSPSIKMLMTRLLHAKNVNNRSAFLYVIFAIAVAA